MTDIKLKVMDIKCRFCLNSPTYRKHKSRCLKYTCKKKCKGYEFWVSIKSGEIIKEIYPYKDDSRISIHIDYVEQKIMVLGWTGTRVQFESKMVEFKSLDDMNKFIRNLLILG